MNKHVKSLYFENNKSIIVSTVNINLGQIKELSRVNIIQIMF